MQQKEKTRRAGAAVEGSLALFLLLGVLLASCGEDTTGPPTRDEVALFGYLYVGESMGEENAIYLTRTRPVLEQYDPQDAAVTGAIVTLRKEGAERADTLAMVAPGRYANPAISIEPRTKYTMTAEIEGWPPITAATTTPDTFTVLREPVELPGEMVQSAIPDSFPIVLVCPDPEQILVVDVYCLEEWQNAYFIHEMGSSDTPQDYQEYGGDDGEPRHIFAYFRAKDIEHEGSTYIVTWYGDMMWFYGEQQVGLFAIDQNYYNYIYRDHPELNGGVTGGIGVFASACRRQWHVKAVK
jgi:hypothetical protein